MAILAGGAAAIFGQNYVIIAALLVVAVIAFLIISIRIISRLLIVELPLAIENNIGATSAIGRSWELSKGSDALCGYLLLPFWFHSRSRLLCKYLLGTFVELFSVDFSQNLVYFT